MYKIMDGNEACSHISYKFIEVAGIYPITPSSTMGELIDKKASNGEKNFFNETVKVSIMQSEAGVAGMLHGSLQAGCLTSTYTASQGLLLMIPNMYKIAGELLPCVINVASRSLATHALSILGDHQDIYATRSTGFAILANSSVQDVMDLTAIAYLSTLKGRIPFVNFFDGFRTSHELQKVKVIDTLKLKELIDYNNLDEFRKRSLYPGHNITRGSALNDDVYFQISEGRNKYYDELPDIVNEYMMKINEITQKNYKPFNYYGNKKAKYIIVAMGSVCETIKETIDYLVKKGEKVGLIEVHLYRPFSEKYFLNILPKTVTNIAVLDRTKEPGGVGEPLYLDVNNIIKNNDLKIKVIGGRYGLSGKDTNPGNIISVYDFLKRKENFNNFTIGIIDDLTNKSLPVKDINISDAKEILVYGYGSDGMVSASKDIIKIIGDNSDCFVQGYFQYDSKKSGGITRSHLRFSDKEIRSTYYVKNPYMVICTKDIYLKKFDMLNNIKDNGIFIINTVKTEQELNDYLNSETKKTIINRKLKIYIIDANKLAKEYNLNNKISTIMETIMLKLLDEKSFLKNINILKENINERFKNKDSFVTQNNLNLVDNTLSHLQEVSINNNNLITNNIDDLNIYKRIGALQGDNLKVSELIDNVDGTFIGGSSSYEKQDTFIKAPKYINENCIMCNMCSFVCPHAVIRPYLLNEEEVKNAPQEVKDNLLDANIKGHNLKFIIASNISNCTNCGLCVDICPGKKGEKALVLENKNKLLDANFDKAFEYLNNRVSDKEIFPLNTVKGSQFIESRFKFPGACAGCGETAYLKLLTQLFGESLIIANATGCSSIYASSIPHTSYSIPWANSLFEDNAEFGFGMVVADRKMKTKIKNIITNNINQVDSSYHDILNDYLKDINKITADNLINNLDNINIKELTQLKMFMKPRTVFAVGGDGWAYDIGYNGIDHVLASNEDINILVLDTEVYSNTGGQASKSSHIGSINKFTSTGKETHRKNLAKIALTYPHVYVGTISLGANMQQTINTLVEAKNYQGPSIIIAYSPCINQGIRTGMGSSLEEQKKATLSGYFPLFRYHPEKKSFSLDSKAHFDSYEDFLNNENRYYALNKINSSKKDYFFKANKEKALETYQYYEKLKEKDYDKSDETRED